MNIELLEQIKGWLRDESRQQKFDMSGYIGGEQENWCGTACCIAGAAVMLEDTKGLTPIELTREIIWDRDSTIFDEASKSLGLTIEQSYELFVVMDKQEGKIGGDLDRRSEFLASITPDQAIAAIDNLIVTGSPKWRSIVNP